MNLNIAAFYIIQWLTVVLGNGTGLLPKPELARTYYFSVKGDDGNAGDIRHPWKSINKLNSLELKPGDSVFMAGGEQFEGNILLKAGSAGRRGKEIYIGSYGRGRALIDGGDSSGIVLYLLQHIRIHNLELRGNGRKNGNKKDGLAIINCSQIRIDSLDIHGFQKSGLLIYSSSNIEISGAYSHDNGSAGITVEGNDGKRNSNHIVIRNSVAENNPGDPTNLTNHSGNGIVVGHCTNVMIEACSATNNGWDMPRIGNGPVGIWAYEADSISIQHCLSYRNKTSPGAADGGGFDLDGGVTNSVVQYCLSYENQGSGYCIFQYWGASPWYNNVFRYNISENDGNISDSKGGAYVWNSSDNANEFHDCLFYNNTIYNSSNAALSFSEKSERKGFRFYNNIFVGKDSLIRGDKGSDQFIGNNWWSLDQKFNADGIMVFEDWCRKYNLEQYAGKIAGLNIDPKFKKPGKSVITQTAKLQLYDAYMPQKGSVLFSDGLNLSKEFGIQTGQLDFSLKPAVPRAIGALTANYKRK